MEVALSRFARNSAGWRNPANSMPSSNGSSGGAMYLGDIRDFGISPTHFPTEGELKCSLNSMNEFLENSAAFGGAIAGFRLSELSMDDLTFFENLGWQGGALYLKSHVGHFPSSGVNPNNYVHGRNLTFVSNAASYGGAIHLEASGQAATLENSGISPKSVSYQGFDSSCVKIIFPKLLPSKLKLYESWGMSPFALADFGLNSSLTGGNNNEDDLFFENCSFPGTIAMLSGAAFYVQTARAG